MQATYKCQMWCHVQLLNTKNKQHCFRESINFYNKYNIYNNKTVYKYHQHNHNNKTYSTILHCGMETKTKKLNIYK